MLSRTSVKKHIKYIVYFLFFSTLLYFLAAFILSSIPLYTDTNNTGEADVDVPVIYLVSNGVHVDMAIPLNDTHTEWAKIFGLDKLDNYETYKYAYVGWGEENFYINTPQWSDLTLSTAVKAFFIPTRSALHIQLGDKPRLGKNTRRLVLSREQYKSLSHYILTSVKTKEKKAVRIGNYTYTGHDAFYYGIDKYHLFMTCNAWMNRGLKKSKIKSVVWTPFVYPLLKS